MGDIEQPQNTILKRLRTKQFNTNINWNDIVSTQNVMSSDLRVTGTIRANTIDWLYGILNSCPHPPEVTHLATWILDWCLTKIPIAKTSIESFAVVAGLIASKYLEDGKLNEDLGYDFCLEDCAVWARKSETYIINLEKYMLRMMEYSIPDANAWAFLDEYMNQLDDVKTLEYFRDTAETFCTLTRYDSIMLQWSPELIATTCLYLAAYNHETYSLLDVIERVTGFDYRNPTRDMQLCMERIMLFKIMVSIPEYDKKEFQYACGHIFNKIKLIVSPWTDLKPVLADKRGEKRSVSEHKEDSVKLTKKGKIESSCEPLPAFPTYQDYVTLQ